MGAGARAPRGRRAARAGRGAARARPRRGIARRPPPRDVRRGPRGLPAHDGHAPLRRPADRRHGAARRLDRRDEDRRGQDADRDARRGAQRAGRQGRPPRDRQRLPGAPRRRVDVAALQRARPQRRRPAEHAAVRGEARRLRRRHHVRHELRVRVRLPARQHGHVAGGEGPARRPDRRERQADRHAPLRDRRRGGQHPHRRGADAADHLRRPRAGRGLLRPLRQARARHAAGQAARGHGPEDEEGVRRRLRLRVRREAQDGLGHRAGRREGRALPGHRQPLQGGERPARQPPQPVAEGRVAVQARRRLRRRRRRGEDHRRVHRPHPRRPALVRGPAPGGRGQGGRAGPGGEPDARHDHAAELLPHVRQAGGDDRHGHHRGQRVHEDLQAAGRPDPDQPADGPQRSQRPDLQDDGRQVDRGRARDRGAPHQRPAGAGRHDLGRGLRAAQRAAQAQGDPRTRS